MTPGIYYFYEYQADKKIRNVGFLKLTQTFQSCHLQISIRQIPAASQEKLPLSMFFFEKDKPRKKTVAELPTQNQCVSCRVTLSEADFPPNLTLAKLHGFLLQTADGRYFAASTGNRPFSVNLLTDWMEPAPCQEPDSEIRITRQHVLHGENKYREHQATDVRLLPVKEDDGSCGIHAAESCCWQAARMVFAGRRDLHN